ncbi:protein of unknown function [Hyphomicrobium sp. MC1]|nr:protein of unknown function [Hyphomicrobium sp. MC1]
MLHILFGRRSDLLRQLQAEFGAGQSRLRTGYRDTHTGMPMAILTKTETACAIETRNLLMRQLAHFFGCRPLLAMLSHRVPPRVTMSRKLSLTQSAQSVR